MSSARAHAKVNLGLVVGPLRPDSKHEVVTVLQRIDLHDDVALAPAERTSVEGFPGDTIVTRALDLLAHEAGADSGWRVRIDKRIPVAAGLGGGSADAGAALGLANATLEWPLSAAELHGVAARVGADVPFFLGERTCLATGDGTSLHPIALPVDYAVVLVVPTGVVKLSTAAVYDAFDDRAGAEGFEHRAEAFERALSAVTIPHDLSRLPANDLAASPVADELVALGAFRADVSGAGPAVYGLFRDAVQAERAEEALRPRGRTYVTRPL